MNTLLYISIFILLLCMPCSAEARKKQTPPVELKALTVEHLDNPLGIDTPTPHFSWKSYSKKNDVRQQSYHILVASSREKLDANEGDLWDSGEVPSARQLWIEYQGKPLKSNQHAYWKVNITTNAGTSAWSNPASFSVGLLSESRWGGRWIGMESMAEGEQRGVHTRMAARYLRKEFQLKSGNIRRATAFIAGLGLYRLYINGKEVGADDVLKPVPSDYRKTIYYNTYDVTSFADSIMAVGVVLGNGRYFPMRQNKPYKTPVFGLPKCRMNIIIEYTDGKQQRLVTDDSWRVTACGPIRANNEYDGEEYDARMEMNGWTLPGYDDSGWVKAERTDIPTGVLTPQMTPSMRTEEVTSALTVTPQGNGINIIDFGQNMAGWISVVPKGRAGDTIRIRYAEKLNDDGTLYTANLRDARSEDIYVCNGKETAPWTPSFVYHGFRYVEVSGPVDHAPNSFKAYAVGDAMASIGNFTCSDTLLNRIIENARWGIRSNYKGMPVDCPQRNERQPWLGDRTAGAFGESFLFDNERLYTKWMRDICEAQRSDGNIPDVAPSFWNYYTDDVTWPAALPFICDMLYRQYGNLQPMQQSYASIRKWANHIMEEYCKDGIVRRDKYGDWCLPPESLKLIHSKDSTLQTDGSLIATAYMVRVMQLMGRYAPLAGNPADTVLWKTQRERLTTRFHEVFLTNRPNTSLSPGHTLYPDSIYYGNNTATANILPLAFGMVPESLREEVVKNLVTTTLVRHGGHVSTGVIGTSWLLTTLSDNGFADVAWLLATQRSYPSWGYMVDNGATTIWELWNGDKANPSMNSGNHVMLIGDLVTWAFTRLAGIRQSDDMAVKGSNGMHRFLLSPLWDIQDCDEVNASYDSPYGMVGSHWKKTLESYSWEIEIPCNTMASVVLPDGSVKEIGSGKHRFEGTIPTSSSMILDDEFLYTHADFPQCHASTIVETDKGDLVAAFFGGPYERHPDVCIYVCRKPHGSDKWSKPILAADGVFEQGTEQARIAGIDSTMTRKACWNPVLCKMQDGELWLFYKIGSSVADWTGWLVKSKDGGKTWSRREPLPAGFLGPIKNKPEWVDGKLLCGSSTEKGGWKLHFEIYDPATDKWKYIGPIEAELAPRTENPSDIKPIDCIQPSILRHPDGRLQVLARTRNGWLATSYSNDGGETWSKVKLSEVPNNQSGTDAVTLRDGRHVLIYNPFSTLPGTKKGPRTPLQIAVSEDGEHWRPLLTLEDSPISQYSYPSIIEGRDGSLHCIYTWRRQRVAYKRIKLTETLKTAKHRYY